MFGPEKETPVAGKTGLEVWGVLEFCVLDTLVSLSRHRGPQRRVRPTEPLQLVFPSSPRPTPAREPPRTVPGVAKCHLRVSVSFRAAVAPRRVLPAPQPWPLLPLLLRAWPCAATWLQFPPVPVGELASAHLPLARREGERVCLQGAAPVPADLGPELRSDVLGTVAGNTR